MVLVSIDLKEAAHKTLGFTLPGNYPDYRGNYPYSPVLGRYHQNNGNAVTLSARWVTSCIRGNYPWLSNDNDGIAEAYYYRPLVWEGNYPHRRAHHIDRRLLSSLLIDDDGLVATAAAGKVVSGRLFVHDGNANAMSIVVDDGCC
jgi:hypothetical protein